MARNSSPLTDDDWYRIKASCLDPEAVGRGLTIEPSSTRFCSRWGRSATRRGGAITASLAQASTPASGAGASTARWKRYSPRWAKAAGAARAPLAQGMGTYQRWRCGSGISRWR